MLEVKLVLISDVMLRRGAERHLLELLHSTTVVDGICARHALHHPGCRHVTGRGKQIR